MSREDRGGDCLGELTLLGSAALPADLGLCLELKICTAGSLLLVQL